MSLERKKDWEIQTGAGGGAGFEGIEYPGVLKKYNVENLGVNWKKAEFLGVIKNSRCIFMSLGFLPCNFQGV